MTLLTSLCFPEGQYQFLEAIPSRYDNWRLAGTGSDSLQVVLASSYYKSKIDSAVYSIKTFFYDIWERMEDEKISLKIKERLNDVLDIEELKDEQIIPNEDSFFGFGIFLFVIAIFAKKTCVLKESLIAMDDDGCCTLEYSDKLFFLYAKFKDKNRVHCNFSQKESEQYVTKYFSQSDTVLEFSKKILDYGFQ
jgi:hypothetical protein